MSAVGCSPARGGVPPKRTLATVLVVEDERDMADGLRNALEHSGFEVLVEHDGERGLEAALSGRADLIVLDIMLPGVDGVEVCRRVRERNVGTPIIMLTAKGQIEDRVEGLESGADDYVTKPFSVRELIARVRAHLRRGDEAAVAEQVRIGDATVDFAQYAVFRGDDRQRLTEREVTLLKMLLANPNRVVTRDRILNEVWGYDAYPTTRTVDTFMYRLRKKIERDPKAPAHLLTVHGAGYRFVP